jgi:hypothetical protein
MHEVLTPDPAEVACMRTTPHGRPRAGLIDVVDVSG